MDPRIGRALGGMWPRSGDRSAGRSGIVSGTGIEPLDRV